MKRLIWLSLTTLLSLLPFTSHCDQQKIIDNSNNPLSMYYLPKWYINAMIAAQCYSTGMNYLSSNPATAIQAFVLGLNYARRAEAGGGGECAENMSLAISKELKIAQLNLAHDKANDHSSKNKDNNDLGTSDSNNNGNDPGSSQAQVSTPKNNISIRTSGNLVHGTGSQMGGTSRQRASM